MFKEKIIMAKVAIVMGSKSDYEIVKTARDTLEQFGVETECRIISAHRTPDIAHDFAKNAIKNGFSVIIAAAGKAAHLAGVLASFTTLPVIGIPVKMQLVWQFRFWRLAIKSFAKNLPSIRNKWQIKSRKKIKNFKLK